MKQTEPLHAIVTGGAGFIGSHLCATLLAQGWSVTCIDNFQTGSLRNVAGLRSHSRFMLLERDVTRPLPRSLAADRIYHLASPASVSDYLALPLETLRVNSLGTLQLLALAQHCGARFLYTSTSEVYGDPLVHPQVESYWGNVNPNGPRACYDESKRFGEAAVMEYCRTARLDARIVRIFNTYGPHSRPDDGRVVPNFIMQAIHHQPITIYGDGSQTRSFCYVSDLVDGLVAAMETPGTRGEVFNLGNPEEHTVLEFARIIASQLGSEAGVIHCPLPVDDPTRRRPDITKASEHLSWEPTIDLSTGVEKTAAWFRLLLASAAPAA